MPSDPKPEPARAPRAPEGEPARWLDDRRNVDRLVYALYAFAALLLLIDPLVEKHGPFAVEHWVGFYGIYALVGSVVLVLAARGLRQLVMRPEGHYDR